MASGVWQVSSCAARGWVEAIPSYGLVLSFRNIVYRGKVIHLISCEHRHAGVGIYARCDR